MRGASRHWPADVMEFERDMSKDPNTERNYEEIELDIRKGLRESKKEIISRETICIGLSNWQHRKLVRCKSGNTGQKSRLGLHEEVSQIERYINN